MENQGSDSQNTLRETLENNLSLAETGDLPSVDIPVSAPAEKPRDEDGKFAKQVRETPMRETPIKDTSPNPSPVATTHDLPEDVNGIPRPSTWKKEYLPIWDKLNNGEQLTKDEATQLLKYQNQRENEYKTGVSTYKGEAENAKALQEAIAPFIPDLQKNGIHPAAWINNLGRAHQTLALGTDQQRLEAFVKLAQDYRVPLEALLGGQQPDQNVAIQMNELNQTRSQVEQLAQWIENEKKSRVVNEINEVKSDAEHFPHFDQVRETMAQLLETGLAPDLKTAYAKAVRMQDDVWQMEQERLLNAAKSEASKTQQVTKAKAAAVSLKTSTPRVQANAKSETDRRTALESAFDEYAVSRV